MTELSDTDTQDIQDVGPESYFNRELNWLGFARRVLSMAESGEVPLLERIRFAGIVGMLHDEFAMKRMSGLMRNLAEGRTKILSGGLSAEEALAACREELRVQTGELASLVRDELQPLLAEAGHPILDHGELDEEARAVIRERFRESVLPILTPLAVDAAHPFPFISNLRLNLAVILPSKGKRKQRFLRIKVPGNRPRWMEVPGGGVVPLEQVIAANLDLILPGEPEATWCFRVTRGADATPPEGAVLTMEEATGEPGSIVRQVSHELKARKFAGVVCVQVSEEMPKERRRWLAEQLAVTPDDVYPKFSHLGLADLLSLEVVGRPDLAYPVHQPATHVALRGMDPQDTGAIFARLREGNVLLHHPYHSFDTSVLRLIESAARDPDVLGIKLTIYRTSRDSPIVLALAEAARLGKQVAVLVEITARFDEAPNIAWGQYLEREGAHVSYGVESLKTHVKLALVVREEQGRIRRYAHVGTGNYHSGTARVYEDLGLLTCDPLVCDEVSAVFNALTGSTPLPDGGRLLVAPTFLRARMSDLIQTEAENAQEGRPSGIRAKMNQLQDRRIIRELYAASGAGVPVDLYVRGLNCLRPGVEGLSENIRVSCVVGRFLEHSRLYRFENAGRPRHFLGSADWMKRNLDRRVETVLEVVDPALQAELDVILDAYDQDNCTAWDCLPDGGYVRRRPAEGEERRAAQEMLKARA